MFLQTRRFEFVKVVAALRGDESLGLAGMSNDIWLLVKCGSALCSPALLPFEQSVTTYLT